MSKRNIKNVLVGITAICILSQGVYASGEEGDIANNSSINIEKLQKLFYNRGLKDGVEKGYEEGYKMALHDAKAKIQQYKTKILTYENGKYLSSHGKITAPQPYQYIDRTDGSMRIVVRGCKIEGLLSPKDIIDLPLFPDAINVTGDTRGSYRENSLYHNESLNNDVSNSVAVVRRDMSSYRVENPSLEFTDSTSVLVDNNSYYNKRLTQANIPYTLSSNDKIKVLLKTKQEKDVFYNEIHR